MGGAFRPQWRELPAIVLRLSLPCRPKRSRIDAKHGDHFLQVLGLYRKRDGARRLHEHGVLVRFRYNGLKEAARAADAPYANSMMGRSVVELWRGCAAEWDT
jgi:hypothetical protein